MKKACALTEIFCFSDYQAPKNGSIKTNMVLHEFWGVRVSSKHLRGCEPLCNTITSPLVTFSPYRVETGETLSRHAKPVLFHFSFKECSSFLQLWQKLTIFFKKAKKFTDYHLTHNFPDSLGRYLVNGCIALSRMNYFFSRRHKHDLKHTFKKASIPELYCTPTILH